MSGATLAALVRAAFGPEPPDKLGVAVSGGGDSTALLVLLDDWRRDGGPELAVATVDHGLRPEAAAEAAAVAALCTRLGVPHETLAWRWDGKGNLSDAARRGRLRLIAGWAKGRGIGMVAQGHTADDQAETFLMRLARGSGVDGLAAMAARRTAEGVAWVRPLLQVRRGDLRAFLRARGVAWADDPTNDDPAYDRVKARQALSTLASLGLTAETLTATAGWMALAREALEHAALRLARDAARVAAGDVVIDAARFAAAPLETQLRLLAAALMWVGGQEYRPRLDGLTHLHAGLVAGKPQTLAGCVVVAAKGALRVTREWRAVRDAVAAPGQPWDCRWVLAGPASPGLTVRALGDAGLRACLDWRAAGLPRASLLASPAVWRGDQLVAAPHAGAANGWTATLSADWPDFFASLVTH